MKRGTVILVSLIPTVGHEQRGSRPCVVVTDPVVTEDQRFPMLAVVPLTGTAGEGALYRDELAAIDDGLKLFLGLGTAAVSR